MDIKDSGVLNFGEFLKGDSKKVDVEDLVDMILTKLLDKVQTDFLMKATIITALVDDDIKARSLALQLGQWFEDSMEGIGYQRKKSEIPFSVADTIVEIMMAMRNEARCGKLIDAMGSPDSPFFVGLREKLRNMGVKLP